MDSNLVHYFPVGSFQCLCYYKVILFKHSYTETFHPQIFYWGKIDKYNYIYLKCTVLFDTQIYCEMITRIKIINTSVTSHSYLLGARGEHLSSSILANFNYIIHFEHDCNLRHMDSGSNPNHTLERMKKGFIKAKLTKCSSFMQMKHCWLG